MTGARALGVGFSLRDQEAHNYEILISGVSPIKWLR